MSGTVVFEDAKLQAVELIAETVTLNNFSVSTATTFQQTTNASNVTTNTLRFTNPATAFVTTGNVEVGTANLFVDTTTGRVGIGTVSPDEKLHVHVNDTSHTQLTLRNDNATHRTGIRIKNAGGQDFNLQHIGGVGQSSNAAIIENFSTTNSGIQFYAKGDGDYRIHTTDNNNERLRILNNGNVGIGTTNPAQPLHIHNNDEQVYTRFTTTAASTTDTFDIACWNSTRSNGDHGIMFINRANTDMRFQTNDTERLRIKNDGDIGIGTNNPRCRLDVQGGGTRCSYPFGIGGSSTYATYTHTGVGGIANNAGSWTKDFVVGSYERGGWIRVYSGATMSTSSAPNGAVQSPKTAEFVYSIYGNSLFWNRVSGSTNISLSSSGYQTIRVTSSGGGSYNHGWVEIWQQGGVAIF